MIAIGQAAGIVVAKAFDARTLRARLIDAERAFWRRPNLTNWLRFDLARWAYDAAVEGLHAAR